MPYARFDLRVAHDYLVLALRFGVGFGQVAGGRGAIGGLGKRDRRAKQKHRTDDSPSRAAAHSGRITLHIHGVRPSGSMVHCSPKVAQTLFDSAGRIGHACA